MNKKDAVGCALKDSIKTILTSGSIMVIAGLILYVVSSTLVLSSIGMYIFRGVGTSILMTIFVLPVLLLLFDGFIEKTTWKANFYKGNKTIDGGSYVFADANGNAVSLEAQAGEDGYSPQKRKGFGSDGSLAQGRKQSESGGMTAPALQKRGVSAAPHNDGFVQKTKTAGEESENYEVEPDFGYDEIFNPYYKDNR
jgi:hypothetical protein